MDIKQNDLHALIVAAGKGSRSKLSKPKSLFEINGNSILSRIVDSLPITQKNIHLVINPLEEKLFQKELTKHSMNINFLFQNTPKGMGDAILRFRESPYFSDCKFVLLIWGDIPFIKTETINKLIEFFLCNKSDFAFPTFISENSYTRVIRNSNGDVISLEESREEGFKPLKGERDIGLFLFQKEKIFDLLELNLDNKFGKQTGEHSFLYIISHLVNMGMKVNALNIASYEETISLNTPEDIEKINSLNF